MNENYINISDSTFQHYLVFTRFANKYLHFQSYSSIFSFLLHLLFCNIIAINLLYRLEPSIVVQRGKDNIIFSLSIKLSIQYLISITNSNVINKIDITPVKLGSFYFEYASISTKKFDYCNIKLYS